MISVLECVGARHDLWLVALAALICLIGSIATMRLFDHATAASGVERFAWVFLTAMIVGTSTWTTHFIAILAYDGGATVRHDPALTILSLLVAVCGAGIATAMGTARRTLPLAPLGGCVLGLAIAAMHYVGMLAFRIEGIVRWHETFVAASVLLAVGLGALAFAVARGLVLKRRAGARTAALLVVATILSLHFTGMTAIEVVPLVPEGAPAAESSSALALATAVAAMLIIVAGTLAYVIDARHRLEAEGRLAQLARTDAMTGLANREGFHTGLDERVSRAEPGESFAVLAFQVMGMDEITQEFGPRLAGIVVQAIARRLEEARRPDVLLARTGATQFGAVGAVEGLAGTKRRAEKLHALLSRDLLIEGCEIPLDVRIGAATFPFDADEAEALMRMAQSAARRAMADPLSPVVLHDETADNEARRRVVLASSLRGSLDRGEFELHFQPQVWIAGRETIGYEALLRWRHPELGMVSPLEFIPIAEKTGKILRLGEWALREACNQAAGWDNACRVAVNVSPLQLRQPDLAERVHEALIQSGLTPSRLEIEVTESLLIEDRARALHVLRRIKALGVRIALDDFGTGYSSIDVLRQIPFDKVKLDKSFVDDIERNPRARAILQAMLALGNELSIPILAEGVESEKQLAILRRQGCSEVQGYLTGRPIPAAAVPEINRLRQTA